MSNILLIIIVSLIVTKISYKLTLKLVFKPLKVFVNQIVKDWKES